LEKKKGDLELICAKNMKILYKNILCKKFEDPSPKYEAWRAPYCPFSAFASSTSCQF